MKINIPMYVAVCHTGTHVGKPTAITQLHPNTTEAMDAGTESIKFWPGTKEFDVFRVGVYMDTKDITIHYPMKD